MTDHEGNGSGQVAEDRPDEDWFLWADDGCWAVTRWQDGQLAEHWAFSTSVSRYRAHLLAAIHALQHCPADKVVDIHTPEAYPFKAISNHWGWTSLDNKKNSDLIQNARDLLDTLPGAAIVWTHRSDASNRYERTRSLALHSLDGPGHADRRARLRSGG